jgi:hypothetical protein
LLSVDAEKIGNINTLADLTIAFVMNLVSAIAARKNTIPIMTLTAKHELYEDYAAKIRDLLDRKNILIKDLIDSILYILIYVSRIDMFLSLFYKAYYYGVKASTIIKR